MGTLHRPLRQHLVLTGGLPKQLKTYEGKVTLPWEFDLYVNGPQLPYCGVQVTLPSPAKSSSNLEVDCLTFYGLLDVDGRTRICADKPHA